jgi:hypothetical protein
LFAPPLFFVIVGWQAGIDVPTSPGVVCAETESNITGGMECRAFH